MKDNFPDTEPAQFKQDKTPAPVDRVVPSHAELAKMTKAGLINELWGEIQTNIELNAQLRAGRTAAAESREEPQFDFEAIGDYIDRVLAGQRELTPAEQKNLRGIYAKLGFVKIGAQQPGESPT